MGASVQLFNKYERVIATATTRPDGRFAFAGLPFDIYAVRVSLATFLPIERDKIAIKPGVDSILQIHMATLLSSIEVNYVLPTGAMTEDWKWVLRSSPATRPVTRFLPELDAKSGANELRPRVFSGTHAIVSVSGGDGGLVDTDSTQGDFGTGFALSTNVLGKNQIQLGGTFGQSGPMGPAAMGLCAIYTRNASGLFGTAPEITLTMAQLGLPGPMMPGAQMAGSSTAPLGNAPQLRTMSLSIYEVADPIDNIHLEYGMTGESVDYLQHTSRVSPFARLTFSDGVAGTLILAYSDGGRPDELTAHSQQPATEVDDATLNDGLSALSRLPQLSERNGRMELQRTQNYEAGYRRVQGSTTYAVSGFYENVSDGRINVAGNVASLDSEDLLSDGVSATSTYNVGNYRRSGYVASADQRLGDRWHAALAYGRMGGFSPNPAAVAQGLGDGKSFLSENNRNVAAVNVSGRMPVTGMIFKASYGWMDSGTIAPRHVFTTQNVYVSPGLNIEVRQPLPSIFGMPGRMEITADLRNLLAQGYVPIADGSDRSLLIVQAPRAIRGGLSFIF